MNLEGICHQACGLVKSTGSFIAREATRFSKNDVEVKGLNQLVSYVDKTAEQQLVEGLSRLLPEAGFLTEEETIATEHREWMWVIDPLDGTTNFVHGVPVYSISVGLLHHNMPKIGIVYEVCRDELFYAWENGKAHLNGRIIQVSRNNDLSKALLATGFPYYDFKIMNAYLEALRIFMKGTHGMRRMGSAAVDLAYVACGRFDGFFEYGLNPWDVAGGILIVREAGGMLADFKGGNDFMFGKEIVAASPGIFNDFHRVLKTAFDQ